MHSLEVGDALVLFDEKRQELHRLEPAAATAWATLQNSPSGTDDQIIVEPDSSLVRQWIERELIICGDRRPSIDRPIDARLRSVATRPYRGKPIDQTRRTGRLYRILGHDIRVGTPSPVEADRIDTVLSHLAPSKPMPPAAALDVVGDRRGYTLVSEEQVLDRCSNMRMLAPAVKAWLTQMAASRTPHLLGLHAAALAIDGGAVLLPAPSGSGKTTLALAGLHAGLGYLSDDMVLLGPEDPVVVPIINALCVKESGLELARRLMPGAAMSVPHLRPDGLTVHYCRPEPADTAAAARRWPVKAIVFPIRSDTMIWATRLSAIETLHRLLANCCSVARPLSLADAKMLIDLVERSQNFEIGLADPTEAIDRIIKLCGNIASGSPARQRGKNTHGKIAG